MAVRVTDRFHVQQLATEALQEMRIKHRWAALDAENEAIEKGKKKDKVCQPTFLDNGYTLKQLLARSRYILYKRAEQWTPSQKERADLLFERYPDIKQGYDLSVGLSNIFEKTTDKIFGLARLATWHEKVRQTGFRASNTISRSIQNHYQTILNYFDNRSTNASAESFNAKLKAFRSQFRGVRISHFSSIDSPKFMLNKTFSSQVLVLIHAQQVIAKLCGLEKWTDLSKASLAKIELSILLFTNMDRLEVQDWDKYVLDIATSNNVKLDDEFKL